MLFIGLPLFVIFLAKSAGSHDCPENQEVSCESLRSSNGFTYTVPSDITCAGNCEQGWYFQNKTFIVDSTQNAGGNRLSIVRDVTPKNLTVSVCENLLWELDCGTCNCNIKYTVTDTKHSPAHDPQEEQDSNHSGNAGLPPWGIALIGIAVAGAVAFIVILFCCFRRDLFCYKSKLNDVV